MELRGATFVTLTIQTIGIRCRNTGIKTFILCAHLREAVRKIPSETGRKKLLQKIRKVLNSSSSLLITFHLSFVRTCIRIGKIEIGFFVLSGLLYLHENGFFFKFFCCFALQKFLHVNLST